MVWVLAAVAGSGFSSHLPLLHAAVPVLTLSGERIERSSPAAADLDGDGVKEIVVGGRDGMLYVIADQGGTWSVVWSRQTAADLRAAGAPTGSPCVSDRSDIQSAPAIADLDGDGHLEIVLSTGGDPANHRNGGVLAYRYRDRWSFSVVAGWPQPGIDQVGGGPRAGDPDGCWDGIWSTPSLGDLDGDGDLEVVIEGFDRRIHAWHHDGTVVDGWPIYRYDEQGNEDRDCLLRGGWSSPALGDIDGDGLPEVVVGTDSPPWDCPGNWEQIDYRYATVWAINGDSSNVPGWPVTTENNVQSSPALGDIDGDGELEVVVGSGLSAEGGDGRRVYAWNGDGSAVAGWPKVTAGNMPAPPALGDLDGDGDLEVVIGCGAEGDAYSPAPCTFLYAWHGDGRSVSGFPISPPANSYPGGDAPNGLPYTPVLADYDGDGQVEILVVNRWAWGISTVERNGQANNDPSLRTQYTLDSSPLVDDVDGDGKLEIAIGGATASGANGALYVWQVGGDAEGDLPWPMFHRDIRRSGFYPRPPRLAFPDEIRVYHDYGSGNVETGSVSVQNEGDGAFEWQITHAIARLQVIPSAGTVTTVAPVQLTIDTTGLITAWHALGSLTIAGTVEGQAVVGSPVASSVSLYVGRPSRSYLPVVVRSY